MKSKLSITVDKELVQEIEKHIAEGMDVYLRLCDKVKSDNSVFHAVRYSRSKHKDSIPQVNDLEFTYLEKQLPHRQLVIFDEDSYSGDTLRYALQFFSGQLNIPKENVLLAVNHGLHHQNVLRGK